MGIINLNCAAGLECSDRIINALTYDLKNFNGNPNANNQRGVNAQIEISYTRAHVATDLNARLTTEILFTSGACESNTYCVGQWLKATPNSYLVTTKTEHASILRLAESTNNSKYISVNNKGCINLGELEKTVSEIGNKFIVSVCMANSETGTVQDIRTISRIVHDYGGVLHVDGTQYYPWNKIDVRDLGIDMLSLSGQKLGAPRGIGVAYVKDEIKLPPLIYGDSYNGNRGGTPPTALINSFRIALNECKDNASNNTLRNAEALYKALHDRFGDTIHLNGLELNKLFRLPNIISLTIDDVDATALVNRADLLGLEIAKGSACQSYENTPSQGLLAIGLTPRQAKNTIRISLSHRTTEKEIEDAIKILVYLIDDLRKENKNTNE